MLQSRRVKISPEGPSLPWVNFFMRMELAQNVQANLRRIDYLRCGEGRQTAKHHEQCGAGERDFIDLHGYREITLNCDTEPAIVAFRNRVAARCKAEVTTEDAVKGDKIRTMQCHIESRTQEPLNDDSPVMPWLVEHAGCILSRCQKGRDGRTPFERLHGKEADTRICPVRRESAGKTNHHRSDEQDEPQISVRSLAWNAKQQCRVLSLEMQTVFFRAREIRRLEPQDR